MSGQVKSVNWALFAQQIALLSGGLYACYVIFKRLDPQYKEKEEAKRKRREVLARLRSNNRVSLGKIETDSYEDVIAGDVIDPESISVRFADVGGLESIVQSLNESVVLPFQRADLFSQSRLLQPPKGILLYGPPGTGKTLLAKAIARESHANFINVKLSSLQDRFFGESQKRIRAVFSLAAKLAPCILFIDEIDSFLRERQSSDDSHLSNMKAEFMAHWDGLQSDQNANPIVVIGATNRPFDVDPAILRRMPRSIEVPLPGTKAREEILRIILRDEDLEPDFDFADLARETVGYSGSDLNELSKSAALALVRDIIRQEQAGGAGGGSAAPQRVRALRVEDFLMAKAAVQPTGSSARTYYQKFVSAGSLRSPASPPNGMRSPKRYEVVRPPKIEEAD